MNKVSILVPIYNAEKYIRKCAKSLFEQTYNNIEYLFVDDASTDNSICELQHVLLEYPMRWKSVKIIRHEKNCGIAVTRNDLIKQTTGDYLMFVDSDDWISNNAVDLLISTAESNNSDIVIANWSIENNRVSKEVCIPILNRQDYIKAVLSRKITASLWAKLYRTDFYMSTGIRFSEHQDYGEDYMVIPQIVYKARRIHYLDHVIYYYRKSNPSSLTNNISPKHVTDLQNVLIVLDKFFLSLPDAASYDKALKIARMKTLVNLIKSAKKTIYDVILYSFQFDTIDNYKLLNIKDRILLFLLKKKLYTLARGYCIIGLKIAILKR